MCSIDQLRMNHDSYSWCIQIKDGCLESFILQIVTVTILVPCIFKYESNYGFFFRLMCYTNLNTEQQFTKERH